jgi:hypothetical protein
MAAKYADLSDSVEMILHVVEAEPDPRIRAEIIKSLNLILSARLTDIIGETVWQLRSQRQDFSVIAEQVGISERAAYRVFRRYKRQSRRTNPLNVVDRDGYIEFTSLSNLSGTRSGRPNRVRTIQSAAGLE